MDTFSNAEHDTVECGVKVSELEKQLLKQSEDNARLREELSTAYSMLVYVNDTVDLIQKDASGAARIWGEVLDGSLRDNGFRKL